MFAFRNNPRGGFTFIELAVALSVVSVGLLAVLGAFPLNLRATTTQSSSIQGQFLAQEKIEGLVGGNYADIPVGTVEIKHDLGGAYAGFAREAVVALIDANFQSTSTDVGLKKITVTVWLPRSYAAQTAILQTIASKR